MPQVARGDERLMVRLWQDPLHAIQSDWYQLIGSGNADETLSIPRELPETIRSRRHGRYALRLLAIMPDTPYAEDRENRRRQRNAIVSALTSGGFIPNDPDHIGYFVMPRLTIAAEDFAATCKDGGLRNRCVALVGFERYTGTGIRDWQTVEVLWLSGQDFGSLDDISALLVAMGHPPTSSAVLLGPHTSGALRAMADQVSSDPDGGDGLWGRLNEFPFDVAGVLGPEPARGTDSTAGRRLDGESDQSGERGMRPTVDAGAIAEQRRRLRIVSSWATVPLDLLLGEPGYSIDERYSVSGSWRENPRKGVQVRRACADT